MQKKPLAFILLTLILSLSTIGCGVSSSTEKNIESVNKRISPIFDGPPEVSSCSGPTPHSSSVTITGDATYTERTVSSDGLGDESLPVSIRHAEFEVVGSAGKRVRCGNLDASGTFTFNVPTSSSSLTLKIYSRVDNNVAKASVLNMPEENILYSLEKNFTPNAN